MKTKILITSLILSLPVLGVETLASLEERVDQLETDSFLHSIKWNGLFEYRYDSIKSKNLGTTNSFNPMRIKAFLDASTPENSKVKFYTRFGLVKYTNDFVNQGTEGSTLNASRVEKGVNLKFERAYINYSIAEDIILSAGRLPTIDGPPTDMIENSPRQGTYPLLAYGAILDGLGLSYNWGFLPAGYKFATRVIYTPFYNSSFDSNNAGEVIKPTYNAGNGPTLKEKTTLYSLMADFETRAIPLFANFNFIAQTVMLKDFDIADTVSRGTNLRAVLASPALGGDGLPDTNVPSVLFAGSTQRFSYNAHTLNTTMTNIGNSNISLGITGLYTVTESRGLIESSAALLAVTNSISGGAALAKKLGIGKGIMTDSADETTRGTTILITSTYITPFSSINSPMIGAEYLHGTKNVLYFGFTTDDVTNFYSTRGNGYHLFWTQPLASGTTLRTGYMLQDHDYSKGYVGSPTRSDLAENTIYANLRYVF